MNVVDEDYHKNIKYSEPRPLKLINKFVEIEHGETKCEKNTNLSGLNLLLSTREEKYDDYIYDFGTFNDEDNNQTLDKSKKDIYDEYDDDMR